MADARYRYSGRRSPTLNPARASMPVGIGYSDSYGGDPHAIPAARYDASIPRRGTEHRTPTAPTKTITTYNVTKDPVTRSSSLRETGHHHGRRRSSTAEGAPRPIIVTTNHAKPQTSSSHTSSGTRPSSPPRDSYRLNDETYYAQPASSMRSRSQNRPHGHGHSQSATLDNDEFYRLRERVGGDERLRLPDPFRNARPQTIYTSTPRTGNSAFTGYDDEGFEYTGPSDLARYDLEQAPSRRNRRESFDKPYYRPSVNIVSNEPARYDGRGGRGPPPTSSGLDRYNRIAAASTYDRPSVTLPAPPVVPPPPLVEPARRPALIEPVQPIHRTPSEEPRMPRPRPVSLYQDPSPRMSYPEDIHRTRDDERIHRDRRDRTDTFRDDNIPSRGFGIRTDLLEPPERRSADTDRHDYDDRRSRRELEDRESRRYSDEELDRIRSRDARKRPEDTHSRSRVEESRDDKDSKESSRGEKVREKVATGLNVAAAAIGLGNGTKEVEDDRDRVGSPRRHRDADFTKEPVSSRAAEKYKPRDSSVLDRRSSPQGEPIVVERREPKRDRDDSKEDSSAGERDRQRDRERGRDRDEREKDRDRARGRESDRDQDRDWERERDRDRRDAEARLTGSDRRDDSPPSDGSGVASRRRNRNSGVFDPTDTQDLMDLKSQLAAMDSKDQPKARAASKERKSQANTDAPSGSEKRPARSRAESRGRETLPAPEEKEKQVRVVSPPREKKPAEKPIKGILKQPSAKFPEDTNPIREGVAPHKDDKSKKDVPPGARWTKINRRMVNPEALTIGKERFEIRDDFVIVLRVLSKDEIQAYATATAQIREMRRREYEKETGYDYDYDRERDDDDRRSRRRDRDRDRDIESDRDRERHRRPRELLDDEPRPKAIEYNGHGDDKHHGRRRSTKDGYE